MTKVKGSYMRTFACSDKNTYVVKFYNEQMGKRILPNEYICGLLARHLELPCYDLRLVHVADELLESENLAFYNGGTHLGIGYDESASELNRFRINKVTNFEDVAKIFVFDQWVYNLDRGMEYSNWLISNGLISIIDHGDALGCRKWTLQNLLERLDLSVSYNNKQFVYSTLYDFIKMHIDPNLHMINLIEEIKGIPSTVIEDMINSIPGFWIETEGKERMLDYLIHRQKNLNELMFVEENKLFAVG